MARWNAPMYEHRSQPLLPRKLFIRRVLAHGGAALVVLAASLSIGVAGYHLTEGMSLLDSFLNASMILGGMGPVGALQTPAGKVFASCYALFSGVVFILVAGLLVAPTAHRILHRMHLEKKRGG